jgi:predicted nucleic acid-binding protein
LEHDRYYLDSNTVMAILESNVPFGAAQKAFLVGMDEGTLACFSSELTLAECLVKPLRDMDSARVDAVLAFLDDRSELPLLKANRAVFVSAAHVRAQARLKLPDAMHVAIADMNGCTVFVTADKNIRLPSSMRRVSFDDL